MDLMWLLSDYRLKDLFVYDTQRSPACVILYLTDANDYGDVTWVWWRLSLFRQATKKIMKLPTQSVTNAEGIVMLWYHHMIQQVISSNRYWILIHRIIPEVYPTVVETLGLMGIGCKVLFGNVTSVLNLICQCPIDTIYNSITQCIKYISFRDRFWNCHTIDCIGGGNFIHIELFICGGPGFRS